LRCFDSDLISPGLFISLSGFDFQAFFSKGI
jgi:hypothetical protein